MATVNHRFLNTNAINMYVAEQGQGLLVLLCQLLLWALGDGEQSAKKLARLG